MTIEYKDSKRIVGLSTDKVETATTPTYTGWAVSGGTTYHSMDSANSEIDFKADRNTAGDRGISKSVGTLNSDTWVARFQLDIDIINKPDGGGLYETFSLNAVDSSVVEQSGNTFIGLALQSSSTEAYFKAVHGVNTGNHSNQVTIGSNGSFVTGTYYVEITRLSATSATVKVFGSTGSDYSTGQIGSTATLNLGSSHTTDLQYFTSKTNSGGADNNYVLGSFKGLKIYDGVTSLTSKPTDVPDNSILVEKDTANRYWFSEALAPTFEDDFSTLTWTKSNSNTNMALSGGKLTATSLDITGGQSPDHNMYKAIGTTLSATTWVAQFEYTPTSTTYARGYAPFAITEDNGNIRGAGSGSNSNTHSIVAYLHDTTGTPVLELRYDKYGGDVGTGGSGAPNLSYGTTYFVTMTKSNANDTTLTVRTGSHTGSQVGSDLTLSNSTYGAEMDNLNYIQSGSVGQANSGETANFSIDNVKIYNAVSTPTPATWTYEPNANSSPLFDTHNGTSSSHSTTITVASNDNRLLIAHVAHSSNLGNTATTVTSVTSNVSGAFTQLMVQNSDSTQNQKTDVWYLKAPATGAHTVTVVYSHTTVSRSIALTSLYNVDQTTPINLSSKAGNGASTGTPITVDITPTVKNSVLMALSQAQYSANTPSDTTIYMASYAGGGDFNISAQKKLSPTRDSVNTMSWSKNSALSWSIVAFEVIGV
jgi:hypothetical protein